MTLLCNPGYSQIVTEEILETLAAFQQRMSSMPARRAELIAEAREAGHSWPAIGRALGMSHQAAMKAAKQS